MEGGALRSAPQAKKKLALSPISYTKLGVTDAPALAAAARLRERTLMDEVLRAVRRCDGALRLLSAPCAEERLLPAIAAKGS